MTDRITAIRAMEKARDELLAWGASALAAHEGGE